VPSLFPPLCLVRAQAVAQGKQFRTLDAMPFGTCTARLAMTLVNVRIASAAHKA